MKILLIIKILISPLSFIFFLFKNCEVSLCLSTKILNFLIIFSPTIYLVDCVSENKGFILLLFSDTSGSSAVSSAVSSAGSTSSTGSTSSAVSTTTSVSTSSSSSASASVAGSSSCPQSFKYKKPLELFSLLVRFFR